MCGGRPHASELMKDLQSSVARPSGVSAARGPRGCLSLTAFGYPGATTEKEGSWIHQGRSLPAECDESMAGHGASGTALRILERTDLGSQVDQTCRRRGQMCWAESGMGWGPWQGGSTVLTEVVEEVTVKS